METNLDDGVERKRRILIVLVSIIIPAAVAFLLFAPWKLEATGDWTAFLPHLNAAINSLTAVILIAAVIAVKRGKVEFHKSLMLSAFALGSIFLISYVTYHASTDSTVFGDIDKSGTLDDAERAAIGSLRTFYLILLLAHILLATIVVPFVLFALYYAFTNKVESHKKIVKFTFPIWLFVSISGVAVYLLISPYY